MLILPSSRLEPEAERKRAPLSCVVRHHWCRQTPIVQIQSLPGLPQNEAQQSRERKYFLEK
jgi:hypothetical protein